MAGGLTVSGLTYVKGVVLYLDSAGGAGGGLAASASFKLRTRCVTRYCSLSFSARSFAVAASACAVQREKACVSAAQP